MSDNDTITAVPGVAVGHWTEPRARTGVTVLTFGEPNIAVADVRGGAPGTREIDVLGAAVKPYIVNAIVLSGGSAFGLGTADGVVTEIHSEGRGWPTPAGPVPIVPTAIVYDLSVADKAWPGPAEGAAAYRARSSDPVALGSIGAGAGVSVANWRGPEAAVRAGIGSAVVDTGQGVVGALVVLNAAGDVFTLDGEALTGGEPAAFGPFGGAGALENTTLICVATDAAIDDRNELRRCAIRAHDALGACVRPTHTRHDGDTVFVVATGGRAPAWDFGQEISVVDVVQHASFIAVGRAIESAIRSVAGFAAEAGEGA